MKMHTLMKSVVFKTLLHGTLAFALSCTDHQIETNLPESKCKTVDGQDRTYPCEFIIEKITFLDKQGGDLASFTGSGETKFFSTAKAKSNVNVSANNYVVTFQARMTLKRVATPSFPVNKGYIFSYTHNASGKRIIHSPGERSNIGDPISLDMPVGESRDLFFDAAVAYELENGQPIPKLGTSLFSFFIDNDVTTNKFDKTGQYGAVGSVVEAYYEKLMVALTN